MRARPAKLAEVPVMMARSDGSVTYASRKARIEDAKEDWKAGRFRPVPGETEFIPLPDV